MDGNKVWWTSKTIWTNLVALIGAGVIAAGFDSNQWAEISTVVLAAVNIALRMVTREPVALG